jgi:hypothetical protein
MEGGNMDELYPGKARGEGFEVYGFARTLPDANSSSPSDHAARLIAGFRSFGRENFFVHHPDPIKPDPSFDFRPLTTQFLANTIENDTSFKFSIVAERIGDVTYVSGAGARDYGGEVRQGMISLHATGGWSSGGLKLCITGELGDRSAFLGKAVAPEFKKASYAIDLGIPWNVLRFLFYDQKGFVISNYDKFK